jgi:hypothetical protein
METRLEELDLPNFHFADLSTGFDQRTAGDEIFLDSYHFGDRGNRIMAEEIFEVIRPLLTR